MPWRTTNLMSLRQEFVTMALQAGVSMSELCRRFEISRKTGYKWLRRYHAEDLRGLADRSRRPHRIRIHVPPVVEETILTLRARHPSWGARKIRRRLHAHGLAPLPACSTITAVLHRHGLIFPEHAGGRRDWQRFVHPVPNSLWQMDFKSPVPCLAGPAQPLTTLDDCSRFSLCLRALPNRQTATVQDALTATFQRYGLPDALLVDNGSPWGDDAEHVYTPLGVWLLRLGIRVTHSRPYHPQTLGKDERFHRTLDTELLHGCQWRDLSHLQGALDRWRDVYNFERPHEALDLDTPAMHYQPSLRPFPDQVPPVEYPAGLLVRKVQQGGVAYLHGREFRIGRAFTGYPIGLQPTQVDGVFDVLFCHQRIDQIDLRDGR